MFLWLKNFSFHCLIAISYQENSPGYKSVAEILHLDFVSVKKQSEKEGKMIIIKAWL